jgi:hypothetical protein
VTAGNANTEVAGPGQAAPAICKLKISDFFGVVFFVAVSAAIFFNVDTFVALTKAHAYIMGFCKFGILATFGECLKTRILTGVWIPSRLFWRVMIWGFIGVWLALAIVLVDGGMKMAAELGLVPQLYPAFWMSFGLNGASGFYISMCVIHYWMDAMVIDGPMWPWQVFGRPGTERWAKVVFFAMVFFWLPAHVFTFSLPLHWRNLTAAYLGICLGLILSFASVGKKA